MDSTDEGGHPQLARTLNEDCLLELFARCPTPEVLNLRQTCKLFNTLLTENQIVWVRRLFADYGMKLAVGPDVEPNKVFSFAKEVYKAPYDVKLRFQAVLVNGGVDSHNLSYWADNLFRNDRSPYCSDCSTNADCLALLLDGEVEREQRYNHVREYLRRRCRYAAALLAQVHQHGPPAQTEEDLGNILERWTDQNLEHFFIGLVGQLENDHQNAMGLLLLFDIPHDRRQAEMDRLISVRAYLLERPQLLMQGMLQLPGELKTMFDTSIIDKLPPDSEKRIVGVTKKVSICRAGSLTCPVASGVVFAGVFDRSRLKGLVPDDIARALQKATQAAMCCRFNNVTSLAAVQELVTSGLLPHIECIEETQEGVVCQFVPPEEDANQISDDFSTSSGPLIRWRPLFWFRFNPVQEEQEFMHGQLMVVPEEGEAPEVGNVINGAGGVGELPNDGAEQEGGSATVSDDMEGMETDSDGSSQQFSDEDIEDLQQGQPMVFGDAQEAIEQMMPDEDDFFHNRTRGRDTLHVVLRHQCTANALLVKLIDQENLMEELEDPHSWPNIDMTYVLVDGKRLVLPPGVQVQP